MRPNHFGLLRALLPALLCLSAPTLAQDSTATASPWAALEEVRHQLARRGKTATTFEQTFIAAGFKGGETETGQLTFSLPDCLRWDYADPYPKSFLICQDTIWYWNETDGTGRRQEIDARNEPGLDLLLLSVDSLAERYTASAETGEDGRVTLSLEPKTETSEIQEAWLTLDPEAGRVTRLEYRDLEGNRTAFTLGDHKPLTGRQVLSPPDGIEWEEG